MTYRAVCLITIAQKTLRADAHRVLQVKNDAIALKPYCESALELMKKKRLSKAKKQTQENGIKNNGILMILGNDIIEWRGDYHLALTALGRQLAQSIHNRFSGWPSGKGQYLKVQSMIAKEVGPVAGNAVAERHFLALERAHASEAENERLSRLVARLQQERDEAQAAEARRRIAVQNQAALARTPTVMGPSHQALPFTPARSTNPAASLPTPSSSLQPQQAPRQVRPEPISPSRPGPSALRQTFNLAQDDDEGMDVDDEPAADADQLPPAFAGFPPTSSSPGPSGDINIHAECEVRERDLKEELNKERKEGREAKAFIAHFRHGAERFPSPPPEAL
ncbi:unnamed protein product [Peniophora sp. CBMAI 1063]|nr:unnamed protein product [Peniophora sp. CBMAI 1063]